MIYSDDYSSGQPKRKNKKKKETAEEYYRLGRRSASLDQTAKDNKQTAEMNMVQSIMLQNQKNELLDVLSEVNRRQNQLDQAMAEALAPPPLGMDVGPPGGMPFGEMPPGGMASPPELGPPQGLPQELPQSATPMGPPPII
ncbi:hypothetical protein LCGC14_0341940 [marine sediment metagenome]|uniref:Uncharacterized protein n=1 Tax=marine sediment metagenome TaxID=412755 RepID=A0A0F9TW51_9ZZZZ